MVLLFASDPTHDEIADSESDCLRELVLTYSKVG